ncbi:DUF2511 domain-containing protein [Halomonas sp. N3-2A]|uniref:DUF2511 domain-containing protein n=1 Tax=Halomonas sp. N3-2A TaxID=2014541 RepID=UPI000B5B2E01|nr:DUF2511 domain-containing protein [Halomonas sp. N3-2A]ASK18374.1 hypothetical protein CEK60_03215 [Halomonas sp. N3-2A]
MIKNIAKTGVGLLLFLVVFGFVAYMVNPEAMQANQQEVKNSEDEILAGELVTKDEFGENWPFTVDEGRIECREAGALVFVRGEFEYQLNGTASQLGYTSINSIWRWNPDIPGTRISITPIIQRAQALC